MTTAGIIRFLNIISAVGLTVGGASTIPGLALPAPVLAYGLFIAAICHAIAGELVQVKGVSDEAQGITPAQLTAVQAVHEAARQSSPQAAAGTAAPPGNGSGALPSAATKALGLIVLAFGLGWLIPGCGSVAPGSDPLVVRTEQAETAAYSTFDTFLKLDDIAMKNAAVSNAWAGAAHPFASYLRKPILNGTNMVPFGIATILSVDQIKLAYQAGTSTSNALITALDTLAATVGQAGQYTALMQNAK